MNLTVIVPPPFEPVTLSEVYTHLRLDPDGSPLEHADDAMLLGFIRSGREFVEIATRRALVQQTLRLSMNAFPGYRHGPGHWYWWSRPALYAGSAEAVCNEVRLARPPLIRVLSVSYYDGDNVLSVVDPANYYVTDEQVPALRFVSGFGYPTAYGRADAVRVEYVAGYAPEGSPPTTQAEFTATIPQTLKDAILLSVQLNYDPLTPSDRAALEKARERMLQAYRIQHAV